MTATTRLASTSKEYLRIPVTADAPVDGLAVDIAVITGPDDPAPADWHSAAWDDGDARILIGPGTAIALQPRRTYTVWIRITSTPEVPVIRAGEIGTY